MHLLDFTMGEDPYYLGEDNEDFRELLNVIGELKQKYSIPVMISPGVVLENVLDQFRKYGIEWYACYQETHNKKLFSKLRLGQDYNSRMEKKFYAKKIGMLIEEGLLAGVGESVEDILLSIENMKILDADQVRVMSFVPQPNTPMANFTTPPRIWELKIIAVLRLVFPQKLIPASLDVDGFAGLDARLRAGANVVTSIIPPALGMMGVSNAELDVNEGKRTTEHITPFLLAKGYMPADMDDYRSWLARKNIDVFKEIR